MNNFIQSIKNYISPLDRLLSSAKADSTPCGNLRTSLTGKAKQPLSLRLQ